MDTLIITLSAVIFVITLLPLLPSNHWLCRVWEFPRVQIAVITFVLLIACFYLDSALTQRILVTLNSLALIYQLIWILPYTRLYPIQVAKATTAVGSTSTHQQSIKIMTSNVLMTNHCADKLLDLIALHQPDIVVTLETNIWWQQALQPLHANFPYRVNKPLENLYGMHLYSKYPLEAVQVINLIEEDIPSIHCYVVLNNNLKVKCHFLHPAPPSPTENTSAKPRDKELLLIANKIKNTTEATIVTGDLNDVAWSPTTRAFRKISGLQDPRIGRGMLNTFHANYPFMRWPLDHIFHSEHFTLATIKRLPSINSDHFPLLSELVYINKSQ